MADSYRWWLVAGVFTVLMVSSGFGFYNLSVYMNALSEQRGFAVADISGATGLLFVVAGVSGIGVARLIARFDVRWVMVGGAAIGGLALTFVGAAESVWQVWLAYAAFGVGNAGVSLIPGTTLITRWFPGANRSVALSVSSTGLSTGGVVVTPLCALVIQRFGIESVMPWFGVTFFVLIAPIAFLMVRSWPPGAEPLTATDSVADDADYRGAVRSRFFMGTALAYVLMMGAQVGGIAHLFNHVAKVSSHGTASYAVSTLAMASIIGRLLGGLIVTRFPIRGFVLLNIGGQVAGLIVVAVAATDVGLLLGAGLFGATVGNLLMLQPLLMAEAFGVRSYPKIYSLANAITTLGVAGGPLLLGIVHDLFDYQPAFLTAAAISALAFFAFAGAGALPSGPAVKPLNSEEVAA